MNYKEFIEKKNRDFTKNPIIKVKDIGRKGNHFWFREAWILMPQSNLNEKVFIIERLRKEAYEGELDKQKLWKKGEIEYRIGYYVVGRIGRAKDRWVWGQFCPFIPQEDLNTLLKKAKADGVIL